MSSYSSVEIGYILSELGYPNVRVGSYKISASCTCAPNKDDHSFGVITAGKFPGYYCHRCKQKGPLADLVWRAWGSGRSVLKSLLIVMSHDMDHLCAEKDDTPKKLEYQPLADKPRVISIEPESKKMTTGVQLDLTGSVAKNIQFSAPAKQVTEEDLKSFWPGPDPYLTARGYDDATQKAFQIRSNRPHRRVVFPIRMWDGTLTGWSQRRTHEGDNCWRCGADIVNRKLLAEKGERDLVNKCASCGTYYAKYMHAAGFRRNDQLYGEWLYRPGVAPVVVEGMTATMNPYQRGLRPPLALPLGLMGGKPGENQIDRLLQKFPDGPIFVLRDHDNPDDYPLLPDGIGPGDEMAAAVRKMICARDPSRDVVDIVPPPYMDPGELTDAHVEKVREIIQSRVAGTGSVSSIFHL